MYLKENSEVKSLPVYPVEELTLEEALLVLAAEKETFSRARINEALTPHRSPDKPAVAA